jgi:hypothetical protein
MPTCFYLRIISYEAGKSLFDFAVLSVINCRLRENVQNFLSPCILVQSLLKEVCLWLFDYFTFISFSLLSRDTLYILFQGLLKEVCL